MATDKLSVWVSCSCWIVGGAFILYVFVHCPNIHPLSIHPPHILAFIQQKGKNKLLIVQKIWSLSADEDSVVRQLSMTCLNSRCVRMRTSLLLTCIVLCCRYQPVGHPRRDLQPCSYLVEPEREDTDITVTFEIALNKLAYSYVWRAWRYEENTSLSCNHCYLFSPA